MQKDAAVKDALAKSLKEEYVFVMEQRSNYAADKDAQIMPRKEECVSMEQRSRDAAGRMHQQCSTMRCVLFVTRSLFHFQ